MGRSISFEGPLGVEQESIYIVAGFGEANKKSPKLWLTIEDAKPLGPKVRDCCGAERYNLTTSGHVIAW